MKNIFCCSALLVIILFISNGCKSSTEPIAESISIKTQNNLYSRTSAETIIISLINNSSKQVFLPIDSTFVLEKKDGNSWITDIWALHRSGIKKYYSLFPNISHQEEMEPGFLPSKGTYRFKFYIYRDSSLTELLPENILYSNPFEVVE
ncbi:MAG: hypothetical protein WCE54_21600 [Ignavibacteriaceae bacterium]